MQPLFTNKYTGFEGVTYIFEFYESDTFDHLPPKQIKQVYAIAFCGDAFIVVNNITKPNSYTPVGGSVEEGENPNDALIREIQEESNMKVLKYKLIGYQKVVSLEENVEPYYQLRYVAIVEPYGPFVCDPAGKVTEVIMCSSDEYKKYFDWGEIGDFIVKRALELKDAL